MLGASGSMGGETVRVLLAHPDVELAWAASRSAAPIERHHPNLLGSGLRCIAAHHPPEIGGNLIASNAVGQPNTLEMEQELGGVANAPVH